MSQYTKLLKSPKTELLAFEESNISSFSDEEGFKNFLGGSITNTRYVVLLLNSERELTGRVIIEINDNIFEVKRVDLLKKSRDKKLCKQMLSFALEKIKDIGLMHGYIINASESKINAFFCYLNAGKENGFKVKYKILTEGTAPYYNMIFSKLLNTNNTNAINKTLTKNHHSTLLLYSLDDNFNFI